VRQITRSEVAQFAAHLRQQTDRGMSIGFAKNQLTSVNVALEPLRGDRRLWLKPGDLPRSLALNCCAHTMAHANLPGISMMNW
jgi:hypothetical protein